MPATLTPEHLQLLSDKRLEEAARQTPEAGDDDAQRSGRQAIARAARYEMSRRRGEVPVRDRYGV